MINYSIENSFLLLKKSIGFITCKELVEKCKKIGMEEKSYSDLDGDVNLPNFDTGYIFYFLTDNNKRALIEILEKEKTILQAKVQIFYPRKLFSSKNNKHYKKIIDLVETHYGVGIPLNIANSKILNYRLNWKIEYTR